MPWLSERLATPLRVRLPRPGAPTDPLQYTVPVHGLKRQASHVARLLPWVLVVLGSIVSLLAAVAINREVSEAGGGLGIEVGAALWFGGILTLGARSRATVGRLVALVGLAVGGVLLLLISLRAGWTGAALDLALEYGVGAIAVTVLDIVLLGLLHARVEAFSSSSTDAVTLAFHSQPPWLSVRSTHLGG